ncbi:E3 ubiquitin-protein ligase RNF213-like [Dreissena polymorpha]|uniref:E3 ubiquitin-protein ligase RNF213-like n=1 Tax=Dreissena polymorpha TaxID=45954 RepID=UPI0022649C5F|nr:E3 ubiquitin-protein ligase RNF213-like [Dreissena polymorpha]
MVYRNEITNAAVLKKLQEKIPQAQLSDDVRKQICEELRALPSVFASLDNLDTAIGFLKTAGGEPIAKLGAFMVEVLGIENPILSQKARQTCELQHARSLWLLLSFHKSKLLVDLRQPTEEVFETFPDNLCQDIPDNAKPTFEEYMKHLSIDKLHTMLEILHELLILVIAVRQNSDDKDYVDTENYCLFESLKQYIDLDDTQWLDGPSNILYKHGAYAWVMAYEALCRKIGTRRRN